VGYRVDTSGGGGRTLSSRTMPYTGLLILIFIAIHLSNFSRYFVDQTLLINVQTTTEKYSQPQWIILYIAFMIVVALHVRHGLWSAFQTIGANHPKYMPVLEKLSVLFAVLVGVGFGSLPIVFRVLA